MSLLGIGPIGHVVGEEKGIVRGSVLKVSLGGEGEGFKVKSYWL